MKKENRNKLVIKDVNSNPFKNIKNNININEDEDLGMCKLILRKLIKDFSYERVFSIIPKQYKYLNSIVERPIDTLVKKYPTVIINKAMSELKEELEKEKK